MDFSEFIRGEEDLDFLSEALLEEGVVGGTLRALGGFGGNLITQAGRGVGNVASGAATAAGGLAKIGLGAVQGLTGGGKQAGSSISSGAQDVASGLGTGLKGVAQGVGAISGVTPTIRAVQAANEKSFFTPMSNRRTGLQKAMGINSWDPEGDEKKDMDEAFSDLKRRYRQAEQAGNKDLMRRIRASMEKVNPKAYRALVAKGRALKAEKSRKRWDAIGQRVGTPESQDDFFRRLATEN
jgi:hypothetical protein